MKILIDGHNIGLERGTGIATYGRNLALLLNENKHEVGVLLSKKNVDSKDDLLREIALVDATQSLNRRTIINRVKDVQSTVSVVFGCKSQEFKLSDKVVLDNFKIAHEGFSRFLSSENIYLRANRYYRWFNNFATVSLNDFDVAHWTYPVPIRAKQTKNIVTLHDLVPLRLPNTTLDNKKNYLKLCRAIVNNADHIITVSETSKKDIVDLLGVDPKIVTNTYQCVNFPNSLLKRSDEEIKSDVERIFNLEYKGYFLYYGAIEPKKNIGRMIEAYLLSSTETPLVLVESGGWQKDEELKLFSILSNLHSKQLGQIIRLKYLPNNLLFSLIKGAKATLFPSIYEGFGLPVLESMSLGTAVITSNVSALPEIGGDAVCYVNPYDSLSIGRAIKNMDSDDGYRVTLEEMGKLRASLFSRESYYKKIMQVYQG